MKNIISQFFRLRRAAEDLERQITHVENSDAYRCIWSELVARGRPYSGPQYGNELKALREVLGVKR
jgi:hypothetical protein